MGGKSNKRFFRGDINGIWKWIRGILVSFVWAGTITNWNGREIQIWGTIINLKLIIEEFINFPIVVLSRLNGLVLALICKSMTE